MIDKPITVQSVNGPAVTRIVGTQTTTPFWSTSNSRCAYLTQGSTLAGFTLTNGATGGDQDGGGVYCESTAVLSNCVVTGNRAFRNAGGVIGGILINCVITGNSAQQFGGGAGEDVMYNCILSGNSASRGGGVYWATLNNCTVAGNSVTFGSLWVCGGALSCALNNCIVYYNYPYNDDNSPFDDSIWNYCCITPNHVGPGNISVPPTFAPDGSYNLASNSPCINAGDNLFVGNSADINGLSRVQGGTVDIGASEYQTPSSILSYAWAQQYNLSTDGSMDHLDLDNTGMENWQKSVAGLNPTNAASVFVMDCPPATNSPAGLTVTWQSVNTRSYYLQRSLDINSGFSTIQSNLMGQIGATSFTDLEATNAGPFFYRVGIQ